MANRELRDLMESLHRTLQCLGDLSARLRRGPLTIKAQEKNLGSLTEKRDKAKAEHQKRVLEAKEKERQMNAAETAIAKRKTQLSEAKTNKEYQALQSQIAADETANSVLADETLEAIEKAEKCLPAVTAAEEELKKGESLLEATRQTVALEEPAIRADIARFSEELHALEKELPSEFREIYGRLVHHFEGPERLAVIVKQKFCGGCNQQVPINSLAQILQKKPITCSCCGRLLFVPEDYVFDRG